MKMTTIPKNPIIISFSEFSVIDFTTFLNVSENWIIYSNKNEKNRWLYQIPRILNITKMANTNNWDSKNSLIKNLYTNLYCLNL